MAAITVRLGREEKEISGLTRKTTCSDVLQALLRNKQAEVNLAAEKGETISPEDAEFNIPNSKNLREAAQSYVIVENWRGCEKPLPPQTRILAVWLAWGKEQCHVKFSLKKDKNIQFRIDRQTNKEETQTHYNNFINMMNHGQQPNSMDTAHFLPKLSHGQKKRISRSIMQYRRAVLIQHAKETTDDNNNSGKQSRHSNPGGCGSNAAGDRTPTSRQKSTETTQVTVTLSEEQFVDGVVTGPDCFLRHEGKSKFIRTALDNKEFNREHCTYRRPHHRRRSLILDDSDGLSDQNAIISPPHKREIHHYPYCRKSRRRKSSSRRRQHSRKRHGRVSKQSRKHRSHGGKYSTDSTTTSTGTPSTASELDYESHSEGEDADDEKSIMTEFGSLLSRQKLSQYTGLPCADRYGGVATSARVAMATDSSSGTTTCSETSNTSGSSFSGTSSSETSSSADYESFFAKRAAAAKVQSTVEKSKSGSGAAKLFRKVAKPSLSQSFMASFKKKRKAPQPPSSMSSSSTSKDTASSSNTKTLNKQGLANQPSPIVKEKSSGRNATNVSTKNDVITAAVSCATTENRSSDSGLSTPDNQSASKSITNEKVKVSEDNEAQKSLENLKQLVISQEQVLSEKQGKTRSTDVEIEQIESQVHKWRTQAHGKNYVQDTYLSGLGDPITMGPIAAISDQRPYQFANASLRSPKWVNECQDQNILSEYVQTCERIVDAQMRIEECKRRAEIILQDMQDEVWKVSGDPTSDTQANPLTAPALGLVSGRDDDSSDDEAQTSSVSLSVTSGKSNKSSQVNVDNNKNSSDGTLEVERSRTELEANLYLSLRLSTELEEVDHLMGASQRLLQSKGEALLNLVRELAQSPEGISPELWDEYGELLAAYDAEVALQQYLASCAENDNFNRIRAETEAAQIAENKAQTILVNNGFDAVPTSPTSSALHHALTPWLWCEHCKHELEQHDELGANLPSETPHWLSHPAVPVRFSELPLPSPSPIKEPFGMPTRSSACKTPLLPMLPVPGGNDSDYEELPDKCNNNLRNDGTSTIISTENATPCGMTFLHHPGCRQTQESPVPNSTQIKDLLSSTSKSNATNGDDSGNASAGSTNSDAASTDMGSRNSSCDGGSPRPPSISTESQDSAQSSPYFNRGNTKRSSTKSKFPFPPLPSQEDALKFFSKTSKSPSRANQSKTRSCYKPPVPLKQGTIASAPASPADSSRFAFEQNRLEQQTKIIRRNSGRVKRNPPTNEQFGKRANSFGKSGIRPGLLPNHLNGIHTKPILHNSHCDLDQTITIKDKRQTPYNYNDNYKIKHIKDCPSPLDFMGSNGGIPNHFRYPRSAPCSPYVVSNNNSMSVRDGKRVDIRSHGVNTAKRPTAPLTESQNMYDNDSDTGLSSLHSTDSVDMLNMYSETLV